jgi:hypothetical protein
MRYTKGQQLFKRSLQLVKQILLIAFDRHQVIIAPGNDLLRWFFEVGRASRLKQTS